MKNTITIDYNLCAYCFHETLNMWKYKGKFLLVVKELSNGDDEMRYCDENGNILSDSPTVIGHVFDDLTDAQCIIQKQSQ